MSRIVARLAAPPGPDALPRTPESPARIVRSALESVETMLDLAGIVIDVGDEDAPDVLCDRGAIEQVVARLIANAVAAAARHSFPRITIRAGAPSAPCEPQRAGVEFVIKQAGHGCAANEAARCFGPSDGDRVRLDECRALVEAQGGRLWWEAEDWGRISFRVTLPQAAQ
jgi:K+-sensing histidine kinase KdpD